MAQKKIRFAAGFVAIIGAVLYFVLTGFQEGKAYYRTLEELDAMGPSVTGKRLRIAGIVTEGSIERNGPEVSFQLEQEHRRLSVNYSGSQPVPDTFKGGVEAVVEGERKPDGTFEADMIQAKCASKYEAEDGGEHPTQDS
jgi:cytochrome c-type biogenesis protein CcmE